MRTKVNNWIDVFYEVFSRYIRGRVSQMLIYYTKGELQPWGQINLQVNNTGNTQRRSLLYFCRASEWNKEWTQLEIWLNFLSKYFRYNNLLNNSLSFMTFTIIISFYAAKYAYWTPHLMQMTKFQLSTDNYLITVMFTYMCKICVVKTLFLESKH